MPWQDLAGRTRPARWAGALTCCCPQISLSCAWHGQLGRAVLTCRQGCGLGLRKGHVHGTLQPGVREVHTTRRL